MDSGGLVHLWNKSGIQILVLVSFSFQVFLLAFGGSRRRSSSPFVRLTTWMGYLLADSTAIYALGHLSVASGSSEHQLVPFWAPFLLLHLGGPDNITAYAIEDNRLWQRHLQVLTVQVLGAAYVIYKYMDNGSTLLLLASISMFAAGLVKYGERTWALKCSNFSSIRSSLSCMHNNGHPHPCQLLRQDMSDEDILLLAHDSFHICKSVFTDFPVDRNCDNDCSSPTQCVANQYKLIEMELSLMYDALYTKALVIYTWYGFCIRLVSVLGTATAFLLFQFRIINVGNGYSKGDVIVSYVLLVGALVLEAISLCKAVLSSWTRSLLRCKGEGWEWLVHVLTFLGRHVQPASSRLLEGSIGQYNLFHLCTRDRKKLGSRLAKKMGMEDWWNKLHFTGSFSPTTSDFKELVYGAVPLLSFDCDPRGTSVLKNKGIWKSFHRLQFGIDFNESILIWNIVTEKCIHISKAKDREEQGKLQAIEVLSNYLMFLMVVKPEMLPDPPRPHKAHADVCHVWEKIWSRLHEEGNPASHRSWNPCNVLKKQFQGLMELFHHDGPNESRIPEREKLVQKMFDAMYQAEHVVPLHPLESNYAPGSILYKAEDIAEELFEKTEWSDALKILLEVWVEMLVYAGEHCSRDAHARHLSNGGEFITVLWLMVKYDSYRRALVYDKAKQAYEQEYGAPFPLDRKLEAEAEPNPTLPPCPPELEEQAEVLERPLPLPLQLGEVSEEDLKQYDGSDPRKPLLMAIKGQIYDVSASRVSYGPGAPYALYGGKDVSRALAKMSFEPQDLTGDISGLEPSELEVLQEYEYKFMSKYVKVGTIKKSAPLADGSTTSP